MAKQTLIGKDFTPPDVVPKVTGRARYAEDFRAEGMVFAKLLRSPHPHARVRSIDTSRAERMEGVVGILRPEDVPHDNPLDEPILASEPMYAGEPVLAVAAVSETVAAEAVAAIEVDFETLPFVTDPLDSLRPGGPDAREQGNVADPRMEVRTLKWTARDFAALRQGQLPRGEPAEQWQYGDLEAGFAAADLVIEDNYVTQVMSHHSMEPRTALAYWQNGKLYLHGSSQSLAFAVPRIAGTVGIDPADLVFISENAGGGFGSKGTTYAQYGIPALLAKKVGRPVMLRVTRDEEHAFGRCRAGFQGWLKLGFRKDGRLLAVDAYVVHSNGPYHGFWDWRNLGSTISITYQPESLRWRGVPVLTNTPPRSAQRGPGQTQAAVAVEPLLDRAARELGLDRVAIRRINAPGHDAKMGPKQEPITSSYLKEALDIGEEKFRWREQRKLSGKRQGSRVTGVGVGVAYHNAGYGGFDGLVAIKPDGRLYIHNGVGNLGTYSHSATARAAAEALNMPWDRCEVLFGDTRKQVPWNIGQFGSNTSFTMSRTNHVAAMDARRKLQELAAGELGGAPEDYETGDGRVFRKDNPSRGMGFGEAARLAIAKGGRYSGGELPDDINPMTARSARALAGTGLIGVAKDTLEKRGSVPAFTAGFARIELDVETGELEIMEFLGVADCGTVIHPQSLGTQVLGGAVQGFGMALSEKHIFDPKYGLSGARGLYNSKPPTYLDVPLEMEWAAVDQPDPYNPVGAKGIGEPPMGAGSAAVMGAISDALGGMHFARSPITRDMIVNALSGREQSYKPLQVNV